jgi:hypothetical protein
MTSHEPTIIDYADQIFKVEMIKGESIAVSV